MKINTYLHIDKKSINFDYKTIIKTLAKAIEDRFKDKKECSLVITNNEEIHYLNKTYRNIDRPTDVLSFEEERENEDDKYLGDIIISIDKVHEQALEYGHSNEREFAFLLCHGLLHIRGYDHMEKEDEEIMFKLQDEILDQTIYKR